MVYPSLIGIGWHLAVPPLPHHRAWAYGSVPRRFDRIEPGRADRVGGDQASRRVCCVGPVGPPRVPPCASRPSVTRRRLRRGSGGRQGRRSSVKRLWPLFHCRHRYARGRRRIHASRFVSTRGVWQKPKQLRQLIRHGANVSIICCRLMPPVRPVSSRTRFLNVARAFGAMRRSLPSFEMRNPRKSRSSGRATALLASLTLSLSVFLAWRNRVEHCQ